MAGKRKLTRTMDAPSSNASGSARPRARSSRHGRPAVGRPQTIPDQIASHVAAAILRGEYKGGEHIREQELADHYGISRGPVREAIRTLEKRGLVEFFPRRGAYAVDISLDFIADFFNVRATLIGLAARYFTLAALPEGLSVFKKRLAEFRELARQDDSEAVEVSYASARVSSAFYQYCNNPYLNRTIRDQGSSSIWDPIWREQPVDLVTPKRRQELLDDWVRLEKCILSGDDSGAERRMRKMLFDSRDTVLTALSALRKQTVDKAKLLKE